MNEEGDSQNFLTRLYSNHRDRIRSSESRFIKYSAFFVLSVGLIAIILIPYNSNYSYFVLSIIMLMSIPIFAVPFYEMEERDKSHLPDIILFSIIGVLLLILSFYLLFTTANMILFLMVFNISLMMIFSLALPMIGGRYSTADVSIPSYSVLEEHDIVNNPEDNNFFMGEEEMAAYISMVESHKYHLRWEPLISGLNNQRIRVPIYSDTVSQDYITLMNKGLCPEHLDEYHDIEAIMEPVIKNNPTIVIETNKHYRYTSDYQIWTNPYTFTIDNSENKMRISILPFETQWIIKLGRKEKKQDRYITLLNAIQNSINEYYMKKYGLRENIEYYSIETSDRSNISR